MYPTILNVWNEPSHVSNDWCNSKNNKRVEGVLWSRMFEGNPLIWAIIGARQWNARILSCNSHVYGSPSLNRGALCVDSISPWWSSQIEKQITITYWNERHYRKKCILATAECAPRQAPALILTWEWQCFSRFCCNQMSTLLQVCLHCWYYFGRRPRVHMMPSLLMPYCEWDRLKPLLVM